MNWVGLQSVAQTSSAHILNALPEGILIAVFAWALLRVLRRQNAGTRFAVWFLALLTLAALPLLSSFGGGRALVAARVSPVLEWVSLQPAITISSRWALFIFGAWALGAGVAMLRLAFGLWRLRQLRRSCSPIALAELDPVVRKTVEGMTASKSSGSGAVTIALSESMRVPSAIGFFKRTIVLPAWTLRELPPEDLSVILLHEFAHLRRSDDWTNLIQKIVRALFFFHPAVWWIEKRLSVEREMACDDAVLAQTASPHRYASCLVSLLEKSLAHRLAQKPFAMAQAAVHRAREASLRLAQILDKNRPVATRVWKPAVVMVGVFSVVCLMTLPQASQFIAFENGVNTNSAMNQAEHPYMLPLHQASLHPEEPMAEVIPASWRTDDSSTAAKAKVTDASVVRKRNGRPTAQGSAVAARSNSASLYRSQTGERLLATSVGVNDSADNNNEQILEFQTLVFIQTTQYGDSAGFMWTIQVWRVTLVSAGREKVARVPVANSI